MHPAEWREENLKPAPTPTPRHELADLAATTSLTGENGEPIVISDIPSIYARNRETMLFWETMVQVAVAAAVITEMETLHSRHCSVNSNFGKVVGESDGSKWSEEMQDWVQDNDTSLGEACRGLTVDIDRGWIYVKAAKKKALDEARRFGVKESITREIIDYLGLDRF